MKGWLGGAPNHSPILFCLNVSFSKVLFDRVQGKFETIIKLLFDHVCGKFEREIKLPKIKFIT